MSADTKTFPRSALLKIKTDPRFLVLSIFIGYLVLGVTVMGFNRSIGQITAITLSCILLDFSFTYLFKRKIIFPLSALITSCSLAFLLNYSHGFTLLFFPVFIAISSKYLLTFNGKHTFNPAQIAVSISLMISGELITAAPAYQWYGPFNLGAFILALGLFVVLPRINRHWLVLSFLITFTLQTLLRAWIMRHHLPFSTLFLGTLSSPAFFLFTFFMITDPATSPSSKKDQIRVGFLIATLDLLFHLKQSYYTFFYAAFTLQSYNLLRKHIPAIIHEGVKVYFVERFIKSGYYKRLFVCALLLLAGYTTYAHYQNSNVKFDNLKLRFTRINPEISNIQADFGDVFTRIDPRVQHFAKWVISVGDSVAVADYDEDGLPDIFFTFMLKKDNQRNSLYKNLGDFKFERIHVPALEASSFDIESQGLPSNAMFVDYDNDDDLDLFITKAFGPPIMLQNQLRQTGKADFVDVTANIGLNNYTNSITAIFFDFNKDGRLDLLIGNVWPKNLPDYPASHSQQLNLFKLPQAEYEGDQRMYNFMHASWHMADNGGVNDLYLQNEDGRFDKQDSNLIGIPEHFWSLAIGTADFNKDGWIDVYVANDFGPDNFYLNKNGKKLEKFEGEMFGEIGKDTYKGMNVSIDDFNNDHNQDIYISNVHHHLQAEGSMLWTFKDAKKLDFKDEATNLNVLNESRFGWGATSADLNNDGQTDLVQSNGMVDDSIDKKFEECPDYWYVNEKIARSPPSIHRYVNNWGDIRGFCIYGKERNRVYLNQIKEKNIFIDVAKEVGLNELTNTRGAASADFNNDGKMDLVLSHMFQGPSLYRNDLKADKDKQNWLMLDLRSKNKLCNSRGIGSLIEIDSIDSAGKTTTQIKETKLVNGFSAQNDGRIHFGLGDAVKIKEVRINWCYQIQKAYSDIKINQLTQLRLD